MSRCPKRAQEICPSCALLFALVTEADSLFSLDGRQTPVLSAHLEKKEEESNVRKAALAMMVFGAMACRAGGGGGGNGGGGGGGGGGGEGTPDAPAAQSTTVKQIRMNQPTNGAMVSLSNVVVTGHVSSKKYGHVWVQDQGGGEYSGIEVFCDYGGTKPSCAMTQAQIDALAIGTVVNVTGSFNSFLLSTAPTGAQPNFEIESPTITATGATMTPVAVDVAASTVAHDQLAASGADPYKGAYVHITGASTFSVTSTTPMEFSMSCTDKSMPPQTGTTYGGVELSAGATMLDVGLNFYNTVTYCLPCSGVAMPYACANPITNQTFTGLSGIVEPEYNSNGKVYLQISPTSDSDLTHN